MPQPRRLHFVHYRRYDHIGGVSLLACLLCLGCSFPEVNLTEKACPCSPGWTCDTATNRCVMRGSLSASRPEATDDAGTQQSEGDSSVAPPEHPEPGPVNRPAVTSDGGMPTSETDGGTPNDAQTPPHDASEHVDAGERPLASDGGGDACPDDPDKIEPGACGCGVPEGNCRAQGTITRQVWTGISGAALAELTEHAAYPDAPNFSDALTSFEAPSGWANQYGTRIVGYLHPPVSGNYTFWIASDDTGELWLSTDDSPENRRRIAHMPVYSAPREWTGLPEQASPVIRLTAGQRYFVEALHKEDGGEDHLAVAWQPPGGVRHVIGGEYLSPLEDACPDDRSKSEPGICGCGVPEGSCGSEDGCGDGRIDSAAGEYCDDGNNVDGDGCAADCHAEGRQLGATSRSEAIDDTTSNAGETDGLCGSHAVAIGLYGRSGGWFDHVGLRCQVLDDGFRLTGAPFDGPRIGTRSGGGSFDPLLCPQGEVLVAITATHDSRFRALRGHCRLGSTVRAGASNELGTSPTALQDTGRGDGAVTTTVACPAGSAVMGFGGAEAQDGSASELYLQCQSMTDD